MPGASEIKAGEAYVEVGARLGPLDKALAAARGKLKAFGQNAVDLGKKFLIAGAAMATPLALAIDKAGDYEETLSKFRAVFKELAGPAEEWVTALSSKLGRSQSDLTSFMATLQDTFVPLGFGRAEGFKLSKMLTQLTVDVASFQNKSDPEVLRDFQSALVGNHETVRKYGIIVTEATLKQELLNMGAKKAGKDFTAQQKVMARLNIIMRGTADAQGDAERTAGSWANTKKRLAAEIENVALAVGNHLLPVVTPMLSKVANVVKWTALWIRENKQVILTIAKIATVLLATGAALVTFGLAVKALSVLLSPGGIFGIAVVAILHFSGALDGVFAKWKAFVEGINLGGKTVKERMESLKDVWTSLKPVWTAGIAALRSTWDVFIDGVTEGVHRLASTVVRVFIRIFDRMFLAFRERAKGMHGIQKTIVKNLSSTFDIIATSLVSVDADIRKLFPALEKATERSSDKMKKKWGEVGAAVKNASGEVKDFLGEVTEGLAAGLPTLEIPSLKPGELGGLFPALAAPGKPGAGGVVGTFAGAAAMQLAPGTRILDRQLDEMKTQTELLKGINKNTEETTGTFGT